MRAIQSMRLGALTLALVLPLTLTGAKPYGEISDLKVAKPEDKQDVPEVPPPTGALVLFDGQNTDQWITVEGREPIPWPLVAGDAMQVRGTGIKTKKEFAGHFQLHLEFRVPYMPDAQGQARGNSGVYLQGRYEVQVLDSYGLTPRSDDCGGIYQVSAPKVNACKAPTVWQSYDIDFHAPQFQDGRKVEPARITVRQNGILIQDHVAIPLDNTLGSLGGDPSQPGPIHLQNHGNPVQYRNIWLLPLD